jgi:hypothetical protein
MDSFLYKKVAFSKLLGTLMHQFFKTQVIMKE